jgi:transposase
LLKQPKDARSYLQELCRRSPETATCASLAREFFRIIRQRDAVAWPGWRDAAPASPLANFVKLLCRDEKAVLAALQLPWSTAQLKGMFTD